MTKRGERDRTSVVVAGARTPMGRMLGAFSGLSAPSLGGFAVRAALERAGIAADAVQQVILGQVIAAGAGQAPARQAAVAAGLPMSVPAMSVNKVCLSGLTAVALADQAIRAGEADIVVAGGMESMTNAPHLLPDGRKGHKFGNVELLDSLFHDGLTDSFDKISMGASTERHNARLGISREEQDVFAARSHRLAAAAIENGVFDDEIVPVTVAKRGGETVVTTDEGVRKDTTVETLSRLAPAFTDDGTITAGSASQISDGAAALVIMSKTKAEELGLAWLAEIGSYGSVAGPDNSLHSQPSRAIAAALAKEGAEVADLDLIEINEAFAAVVIQSIRDLDLSAEQVESKVNINGGAIALGHPVGASGARLLLHLAQRLNRTNARLAVAALCGGGGQGDALILRAP